MQRIFLLQLLFVTICDICNTLPFSNVEIQNTNSILIRGKWFRRDGLSQIPKSQQITKSETFRQCLDHFSESGCDNPWSQRFWTKSDFYVPNGPIFFQFGGEGPADGYIDGFYWVNYAREHGAYLIVLEHRFYGQSIPTDDSSFEALELLTSQQALADAANFINQFKIDYGLENSKWVTFGGSYAGNLAAWMKQKYPQLINSAVSSSAPVEAVYHFPEYLETVSKVVEALDSECYKRTYEAFQCMESLVNGYNCSTYTSPNEIPPALNMCSEVDFEDQLEKELFFNLLAMGTWGYNWPELIVQYNCGLLNDASGDDPLKRYGNFLGQSCKNPNDQRSSFIQSKDQEILDFINSKEGKMSGAAGWFWQTCYEFGYYMSSDPKYGLFGYKTFSGRAYGASCLTEYGDRFTTEYIESRIAETNAYYKGQDFDGDCVIFVNGEWDPWHSLGIITATETSSNNTVLLVPEAEHCDDMQFPTTEDMRLTQEKIMIQIGVYLNEPYCST